MSNSEVTAKTSELLDSLKPYGTYPRNPGNESSASSSSEFSVGELYGCVCHRPFDELARSRLGSIPASGGLQLTE
jgi:hypothetical protein